MHLAGHHGSPNAFGRASWGFQKPNRIWPFILGWKNLKINHIFVAKSKSKMWLGFWKPRHKSIGFGDPGKLNPMDVRAMCDCSAPWQANCDWVSRNPVTHRMKKTCWKCDWFWYVLIDFVKISLIEHLSTEVSIAMKYKLIPWQTFSWIASMFVHCFN